MQTLRQILLSPPLLSTIHPLARDWVNRVTINGGSVSINTIMALSRYIAAKQRLGTWDLLKRVNLFCGNNLAACLTPLKVESGGLASDSNTGFVATDFNERGINGGLRGNGSSKYLLTGFIPSTQLAANSAYMGVWNRTTGNQTGFDIGVRTGGVLGTASALFLGINRSSVMRWDCYGSGVSINVNNPNPDTGLFAGNRIGVMDNRILANGNTANSSMLNANDRPTAQVMVFGFNEGGTPSFFSGRLLAGYWLGEGIPDTIGGVSGIWAKDYAIDLEFQKVLGRA